MNKMRVLLWVYLLAFFSVVHGRDRRPSFPYISGDTFRYYCDLIMDETTPMLDPKAVQEGDAIFLKTDYMPQFFRDVHPYIAYRYILVTHNSDYPAPREFGHMLDDPKMIAWFAQNVENCSHPKLHPIPIGLANRYWGHGNIDVLRSVQRSYRDFPRATFLYMNFSVGTNVYERQPVYNQFKDQPFCTNSPPLDFANYLPVLVRSKFVLSPRGNGLDCHRTWEALYMGAIPILRTSSADSLYEDLPVVIIKDWREVTEEFLVKKEEEMRTKKYRLEKVYAYYWLNLIESYKPGRRVFPSGE
jgi:hypothetical protein